MSAICGSGLNVLSHRAFQGYTIAKDRGVPRFFPPQVALYLVKVACELPDTCGRSLSQWDCTESAVPVRVEHEYERKGALNLFAAFDTRTGFVWGQTYERKRQEEFIAFLEYLNQQVPSHITTIHLVLDNLSVHKGKKVQAWLAQHPRFVFHYPPVHCSWMNQVEQWFSIVQRKRLRIANFTDKQVLAERLQAFIAQWNAIAHPFNWTSKSVAKVMAKCELHSGNLAIAC